jgi:hypothetical protein
MISSSSAVSLPTPVESLVVLLPVRSPRAAMHPALAGIAALLAVVLTFAAFLNWANPGAAHEPFGVMFTDVVWNVTSAPAVAAR